MLMEPTTLGLLRAGCLCASVVCSAPADSEAEVKLAETDCRGPCAGGRSCTWSSATLSPLLSARLAAGRPRRFRSTCWRRAGVQVRT
jgi:hypothetical protein